MAKATRLSMNAQIGLVLGIVLLFSIILSFAGFMAANEVRQKMAAFASDPVVVTGTITQKRIDSVRPTAGGIWVYWLDLAFKTQDGSTRRESTQVANSIFDKYEVGDPVQVTYVRTKPEWFHVPGGAPAARDAGIMAGMQKYGAIAGLISAVGLVGWFFTSRGGGMPAGGTPSLQPPAGASVRMPRQQPRTTFGTRGVRK
jgi:hypothetical protein